MKTDLISLSFTFFGSSKLRKEIDKKLRKKVTKRQKKFCRYQTMNIEKETKSFSEIYFVTVKEKRLNVSVFVLSMALFRFLLFSECNNINL